MGWPRVCEQQQQLKRAALCKQQRQPQACSAASRSPKPCRAVARPRPGLGQAMATTHEKIARYTQKSREDLGAHGRQQEALAENVHREEERHIREGH